MIKEDGFNEDNNTIKVKQMVNIAKMYYLEGKRQEEIAKKLNMSRSNISRILTKSIESGVVQISIKDDRSMHPNIAVNIKNKYDLDVVIISQMYSDRDRTLRKIGETLCTYLIDMLSTDMVLGVTRGPICYYASRSFRNTQALNVDVVQMMGGTQSRDSVQDSLQVAERMAQQLHGTAHILYAPLMTKSKQLRDMLLQEPICKEVFDKYHDINIALLEIDSPRILQSSQLRDSWLSKADSIQLSQMNAVAAVCGRFFDADGLPCNAGINDRIVAIDYENIKKIPLRIGMAYGKHNASATMSILRSGLLNALVIDEGLAFALTKNI